jgi:hypothetical protein
VRIVCGAIRAHATDHWHSEYLQAELSSSIGTCSAISERARPGRPKPIFWPKALAAGVGLFVLCALVAPELRLALASSASAALGAEVRCGSVRRRARVAYLPTYLVPASRDLMVADVMTYRRIARMVARPADAGAWPILSAGRDLTCLASALLRFPYS